jgi:hypothetical protein
MLKIYLHIYLCKEGSADTGNLQIRVLNFTRAFVCLKNLSQCDEINIAMTGVTPSPNFPPTLTIFNVVKKNKLKKYISVSVFQSQQLKKGPIT